jgi:hypothetical protein
MWIMNMRFAAKVPATPLGAREVGAKGPDRLAAAEFTAAGSAVLTRSLCFCGRYAANMVASAISREGPGTQRGRHQGSLRASHRE